MRPLSMLPDYPELFLHMLHQATDDSLATCLRVSKRLFIDAGGILYHTLYLDNNHFSNVFEGTFLDAPPFISSSEVKVEVDGGDAKRTQLARTRWGWRYEVRAKAKTAKTSFKRYLLAQVQILVIGLHEERFCEPFENSREKLQGGSLLPNLKCVRFPAISLYAYDERYMDVWDEQCQTCSLYSAIDCSKVVVRGDLCEARIIGNPPHVCNPIRDSLVKDRQSRPAIFCIYPEDDYSIVNEHGRAPNGELSQICRGAQKIRIILGTGPEFPELPPDSHEDHVSPEQIQRHRIKNAFSCDEIISHYREVCQHQDGLAFEIYGMEQLYLQGIGGKEGTCIRPGTAAHIPLLHSIYDGILELTTTHANGNACTTVRDDMTFGTLDGYYASDTFGELSEWELNPVGEKKQEEGRNNP